MSSPRAAIASGLRAGLLLSLIIGVFLVARGLGPWASPFGQISAAVQRLISIAVSDTSEMGWLVLMCIASGILVLADRRRRAKVRQASS
jgi:hypothetical protein